MDFKSQISFDELDLKVLNQLPLISEVVTSTINKISRILNPIHQEIFQTCNKNLPKEWEVDKKINNNIIYPFTYTESKISSLSNCFQVKNLITLVQKKDNKWTNYIEITFGLFYDDDLENYKEPLFYFNITKDPSLKFGGQLYPLEYYLNIKTEYKEFSILIQHPSNNDDYESIELNLKTSQLDNLTKLAEVFNKQILPHYLNNITV